MEEHHRVTRHESALDDTLDLRGSLNVRVLSSKGLIVGKVSQIRIHPTKMFVEGILIHRGAFKKPIYLGASYIKRISNESIILNIELAVLLNGKRVIDSNGKKLGKIKEVIRKEHSNNIEELIVGAPFRKNFMIDMSKVKSLGESIILKPGYNVQRKYIWQKS